ncbi:MAG TPA: PASTA domain-containing protein [Allosphingosinicella sp.]|nr:PASTA domain-containing protein [Allosphingosinicella sp.]
MPDQAETDERCGDDRQLPIQRGLSLAAGAFAASFDSAIAEATMSRRQQAWIAGMQGEEAAAAAMGARIEAAERRATGFLGELARAYAGAPLPEAGHFLVSGRVRESEASRPGLKVSALDRGGKALTCADTGPGGAFELRIASGDKAVLMVADAQGKPLMIDDRLFDVVPGRSEHVELDLARARKPCPDGPDLSGWTVMPDLVGTLLEEAVAAARQAGLKLAEIRLAPQSERIRAVVATDPAAGRLLAPGAPVTLTIAADPDKFDRELAGAILIAEGAGKLSAEAIVRMLGALALRKITGLEKLAAAARKDDAGFAELTGLSLREAGGMRAAFARVMERFEALRGGRT